MLPKFRRLCQPNGNRISPYRVPPAIIGQNRPSVAERNSIAVEFMMIAPERKATNKATKCWGRANSIPAPQPAIDIAASSIRPIR